ncbi:MAG: hypothetical protein M1831_000344 [Alyxoria varia]|nr:MAG: hypothetical protein M1831_000344 [Alyxoria varia]
MASLLRPIGALALLWLSIPLGILAVFTTSLAFAALFLRVGIVYFELALAIISSWIFTTDTTTKTTASRRSFPSKPASPSSRTTATAQGRASSKRRRRNSGATAAASTTRVPTKSESFASLIGAGGPFRDFEGVGGWRLGDGQDDAIWMGLNSRLELPALGKGEHYHHPRRSNGNIGAAYAGNRQFNHYRSLSAQGNNGFASSPSSRRSSPRDAFRMSVVSAGGLRNGGTPPALPAAPGPRKVPSGYFDFRAEDETIVPMSPEESEAKTRMEQRRRSLGSSSASSMGSSRTPTLATFRVA